MWRKTEKNELIVRSSMKMMCSKAALHSPSFSSLNVRLLCKHKHAWQREQSHFVIPGPGELFKRSPKSRLGFQTRMPRALPVLPSATSATSVTVHADSEEFRAANAGTLRDGLQGTFPTFRPRLRSNIYLSLLLRPQDAAFSHLASWQVAILSILSIEFHPVHPVQNNPRAKAFEGLSSLSTTVSAAVSRFGAGSSPWENWSMKLCTSLWEENAIWCTSATCKLNHETEDQKRKQHGRMICKNSTKKVGQVSFSSFLSAWNVDDVVHEGIVSRESLWLGGAVEAPEGRGLRNVEWQIWWNFLRICLRFSIKILRNAYDKFLLKIIN